MTRILADLPDEDIKWLDQLAAEQGKSPIFRSVIARSIATKQSKAVPSYSRLLRSARNDDVRLANIIESAQ
jgi:hypothetical protein